MTESYSLMRSEPDVNTCRSRATFYYVDGVRVSNHDYSILANGAEYTACYRTTRSKRGRWLYRHIIFYA